MRNPDQLRDFYHDHLMRDILPWWERCGKDYQFGGFMHCITRAGEILSEEKEMVWQGLGLWTFSHVWLVDYARHLRLREFLIKTRDLVGRQACDARGRWPGKLDREGEPVAPAAGVEPALAAACGLLEYHRAMCDEEGLEIARQIAGDVIPAIAGDAGAPPALLTYALGVLTPLLEESATPELAAPAAAITDRLLGLIDAGSGLLVDPGASEKGHYQPVFGFAAGSQLLAEARRRQDGPLAGAAAALIRKHAETDWDREQGGFYDWQVTEGGSPPRAHGDRKPLRTHASALVALMEAYEQGRNPWAIERFEEVHEYVFEHFPDRQNGEMHRLLDRAGQPVEPGDLPPLKDPFHWLRAVMLVIESIDRQTERALPPHGCGHPGA